jgi:hypothetical protein
MAESQQLPLGSAGKIRHPLRAFDHLFTRLMFYATKVIDESNAGE